MMGDIKARDQNEEQSIFVFVEIACLCSVYVPVTQERGGTTAGPHEQQERRLESSPTHHHPLHPTPTPTPE